MQTNFKRIILGLFLFVFIVNTSSVAQNNITSPEEFFGFQMGADYKLARWDKLVDYFNLLDEQSDKIS